MLRLLTWMLIASLLFFLAPGAFAGEDDGESEYARTGWYVGGSAIAAYGASRRDADENQVNGGLNARFGWRESSWLALELGAEWTILRDPSYGIWAYGVNGKIFMMEDRLQPFFLVGAGGMTQKTKSDENSVTDWGFRFGGGADYYLTESWAVTAEASYVWGVGQLWQRDTTSFGLGVLYRF
jgi:opacity protein-like surface antigen